MLAFSPASVWSGEQEPPAPFDVAALQARIDGVAGGVTTLSIPGSLTVTTGDGNDSVGISGNLGGSVIVHLGSADVGNGVVIGSEVSASRVGGSVNVKGGDRNDLFAIGNVSIAGTVSSAIGRDLTVNSGAGSDLISIGTSTVGRNAWLDAGTGNDPVRIDGMRVRRTLFIDLGAGNDSLAVMNLRAFAAFLYGGSGTNSLSTDTATRAAGRTLRHNQFRAVTNG